MLPNTRNAVIFSRLFSWWFQAITPFAVTYWGLLLTQYYPFRHRLPILVESWLLAECLFLLLIYLPMSRNVHGPAIEVKPMTRKERKQLFEKCLATIADPIRYLSLGTVVRPSKASDEKT
jgi:hypothetical protein